MAKLQITSAQKTSVIDAVDTHLQNAFAEGVEVPGAPATPVLDPMEMYATQLDATAQTKTKDVFRQVIAALVKVLGITGVFQASAFQSGGLNTTISYTKSGGGTGTLTFTNGILTGST